MPSFTKDAIKNSFLKLLNLKSFNKITVKDIVEDCGINRNSFYYHFEDIPSLLEEILMDDTNKILQSQESLDSVYDCIMDAMEFALENKTAILHIYNSANRELIEQYLNRVALYAVKKYIDAVSKDYNISDSDKEIIILHYKCLLVGFVIDWLTNGMKYDFPTKLGRLCELFGNSMENAFKICSENK